MSKNIGEVILNPIRIRIVTVLAQSQGLTTAEIMKELPDVAQATLYRHISTLLKAEIIEVIKENRVRGTVEKIYKLSMKSSSEQPQVEEVLNTGYSYFVSLLADFDRYVKARGNNVLEDKITFAKAPLYLNDEEYMELMMSWGKILQKYLPNKADGDRKLRMISTVALLEENQE